MKKLMSIGFFSILFSAFCFGQQAIEAEKPMSEGLKNSLTLELPNSELKEVEKAWISFIKDYKGKKNKKNKKSLEIFSDNVMIEGMSSNTVDVYAKVVPIDGGTQLITWFDLGGAFLNSTQHDKGYWVGQSLISEFDKTFAIQKATEKLEAEEKELKKRKGDLASLVKDEKNYAAKIEELKAEIEKLGAKIVENKEGQVTKESEIAEQEAAVEAAKEVLTKAKERQ